MAKVEFLPTVKDLNIGNLDRFKERYLCCSYFCALILRHLISITSFGEMSCHVSHSLIVLYCICYVYQFLCICPSPLVSGDGCGSCLLPFLDVN